MEPTDHPDDLFDSLNRARQVLDFWIEVGNEHLAQGALIQYLEARSALLAAYARRSARPVDIRDFRS